MKPRLTLQEHKELGANLYEIRSKLGEYVWALSKVYSKSSKQCKLAINAQEAVDKLRRQMEGRLFVEKLKDFNVSIYYPGTKGVGKE